MLLIVIISCKETATPGSHQKAFDNLEKVFGSGNWRHISYGDTVYLSFNRESDTMYKIRSYRFANGDSVETSFINIYSQHDSILMQVDENARLLTNSDSTGNSWKYGDILFVFKKLDSTRIVLREDGRVVDTLRRTPPINEFILSIRQGNNN